MLWIVITESMRVKHNYKELLRCRVNSFEFPKLVDKRLA